MPKYQFVIEGPCAECVATEVSPEVAQYWSTQDTDTFQEYMGCDADSRNDEFDVPENAQIDVEWTEMDSEVHLNGPLVVDGTVLVVWDVDKEKEVIRVPIQKIKIQHDEMLETDVDKGCGWSDSDHPPPPLFKAMAYGKGYFETAPIELPEEAIRIKNIATKVFSFTDDVMIVTAVGVDNNLLDLEEDSSRTNSMSCWID